MKMFDAYKTRMIGLPYGEKNKKKSYDDMLSRLNLILERHGQAYGQTDRFAISISRVSVLTRDKKTEHILEIFILQFLAIFFRSRDI